MLNLSDQNVLVKLLQELRDDQLSGQPIPPALFEALLPITPQVNFEFVVCRREGEKIEVLLVKRPDSVSAYPGHWHCPGAFTRTGDTPKDVSERIRTGKMGGANIKSIRFLDFQMYQDPTRGGATIIRLVHLVEIEGKPPAGEFFEIFPSPNLPTPLVWEQPMLMQAAAMFKFQNP
ncbi:MAG TPA: hypothetical protein VJI96_04050 [Candidatus Andersenbacteria bacterium]|nr:hypothetical protein [Candidatus Andersenbacteria bacterium]